MVRVLLFAGHFVSLSCIFVFNSSEFYVCLDDELSFPLTIGFMARSYPSNDGQTVLNEESLILWLLPWLVLSTNYTVVIKNCHYTRPTIL